MDVLDETVSLRRVALAVRGLPMGSLSDPESPASWTVGDHLLATLIDCVQELTWVTASANSKSKVKRPKPIARPGTRATKPAKKRSWGDFVHDLDALGAG